MGYRLSKIYTRTGDSGTTGLGDGTRVPKDSTRIEACGTIDELNSHLGVVLSGDVPPNVRESLTAIQHLLFDLGGELAVPGSRRIDQRHVEWLEATLDRYNEKLPPLKEFTLPGGNPAAAQCHVARTVCRRSERAAVALSRESVVDPVVLKFLNRLSDLLFVLCRVLARHAGGSEPLWEHGRALPDGQRST